MDPDEVPVALDQPILSGREERGTLSGGQQCDNILRDSCVVVAQQSGRAAGQAHI